MFEECFAFSSGSGVRKLRNYNKGVEPVDLGCFQVKGSVDDIEEVKI